VISEFLSSIDPPDITALWILTAAAVVALSLHRNHRLAAWAVWIVALAAVTAPWADFRAQCNWAHVGWIPFQSPLQKRADIVANVALYIPFGYVAWSDHPGLARRVMVTMSTAAALSFVLETSQLFSVSRYPSTTDVASDIAGAAAGALLAAAMTQIGGLLAPESGG
jgi:glycopeptide antibiotics resistance protein